MNYVIRLISRFTFLWFSDRTDRCAVNNPCQHQCVDTGSAVTCRCFDGFMLEVDGRSCSGHQILLLLLLELILVVYKLITTHYPRRKTPIKLQRKMDHTVAIKRMPKSLLFQMLMNVWLVLIHVSGTKFVSTWLAPLNVKPGHLTLDTPVAREDLDIIS